MSLLPNAANATLDDPKITKYLLDPSHPVGGGKAKFFLSRGFTQANWTELKTALLDHPQHNQVAGQTANPHGERYVISCSLVTPDGSNPCVISVWNIQPTDQIHTRGLLPRIRIRRARLLVRRIVYPDLKTDDARRGETGLINRAKLDLL